MSPESVSFLSTILNLLLTAGKLAAGLATGSASLLAEAIHSGLDVVSSFVTFFGIKIAKKPKDKKHPYGHYRGEVIAGAVVTVLLGVSALWIMYEGGCNLIHHHKAIYSLWGIILMVISVLVNEILARIKFSAGAKSKSISLLADGKHSRADVVSSAGVLLALIVGRYIDWIDPVIALLIGCYILVESFGLAREVLDSLLDVSNGEVEKEIRKIAQDEGVKIRSLRSRRLGAVTLANITILFKPTMHLDQATSTAKNFEKKLVRKIGDLHQVVISIESHDSHQLAEVTQIKV